MKQEELEFLLEKNARLKEFLEASQDKITRRIEGETFFHLCCGRKMIKIGEYQTISNGGGKSHEIRLQEKIYYCTGCNDWYSI